MQSGIFFKKIRNVLESPDDTTGFTKRGRKKWLVDAIDHACIREMIHTLHDLYLFFVAG